MAQYISEGIRFCDQKAIVKKESEIKHTQQIAGFDGYIFGSPTFSLEIPEQMNVFLSMMENVDADGKLGGAFGPYTHDVSYQHNSHAPVKIFKKMQKVLQMVPFELGPLVLQEDIVNTGEGMKACQDYGRVFGEKIGI
jgi:flavorubredoxin